MTTQSGGDPAPQHLVLAAIEDGVRALSIRVLGAYAESLGVRTTLLVIVKPPVSAGQPLVFSPREVRQIAGFLRRERVTHFGMYLMTATLKPYRLLVQALREAGFGGVILAGGVHATLCPEELQVVAMTRRQVAKTVLAQAFVVGLIGIVMGFFAGATTAWVISLTMLPLVGYHIAFALHADLMCGCFVLALAIVLVAAWIPARRATKLDLLEALKYE